MELIVLFFLLPLSLGFALAFSIIALAVIMGAIGLVAWLFISLFGYIFSAMAFIGFIVLAVIGYYSPPLLFFVLLILGLIWTFPEPEGENRNKGLPFVAIFNLFVLPLLIAYFYNIVELDGLTSTFFGLLGTLTFDAVLTIKRPNLVERNINFLWLY